MCTIAASLPVFVPFYQTEKRGEHIIIVSDVSFYGVLALKTVIHEILKENNLTYETAKDKIFASKRGQLQPIKIHSDGVCYL